MESNDFSCKHLQLQDLARQVPQNRYLQKIGNIPEYPKPEFHVSRLKHETSESALRGIRKDGGFRNPYGGSLMFWSLAVGPEEMNDAETRLLEKTFPDRVEVAPEQQSFLWRFATSPAFQEASRLGSFRFTFPLQEVLTAYRDQICSGAEPVMRVHKTVLYKQEVMYAVLVHSPDFNEKFSEFPLLSDDPNAICVYRDGHFIWRSEAMCETHWYKLINHADMMEAERVTNHQYYVWDHVAVALHIEDQQQVLKFNHLQQNLKYCEQDYVKYRGEFQNFDEAKKLVSDLWPEFPGHLEKERPLQLSYPITELTLVLAGSNGEETSSTGNAILGRETFFPSGLCSADMKVDNLEIELINTPDFSELDKAEEKKKKTLDHIRRSGPALQAFLLVIGLEGISADQIRTTVQRFESVFQNRALRTTTILFTQQDETAPDIKEVLEEVQKLLTEKVGNRFWVFNRSPAHRDPQKVSDLLNEVKKMIVGSD